MAELARVDIARDAQGAVHARLTGELDMASAGDVRLRLYEAAGGGAHSLTIDLTDLSFLDSAGVELLFRLREDLAARQMRLTLIVPREARIRRALEVTAGGSELLTIIETPS